MLFPQVNNRFMFQEQQFHWFCYIIINQQKATETFMNNTYSLRAILQSDLDPTLCKLMLHQIKSPLLQHSFQLTTDDEQNGSFSIPGNGENSRFYQRSVNRSTYSKNQNGNNMRHTRERGGEKNKERQKDIEFEKMHQRLIDMSMVVSDQQVTKRSQKQQRKEDMKNNDQTPFVLIAQKKEEHKIQQVKSLVSPFEYNGNIIPHPHSNSFVLDEDHDQDHTEKQNINNDVAKWCGEVFATDYQHADNQIVLDYKPFTRKKIFPVRNQKQSNVSTNINNKKLQQKKKQLSFQQSIEKLQKIQQQSLSSFIQFLSKILNLFDRIGPLKQKLRKNQPILHKFMLSYNPVDHQFKQTIANKNRIVSRLSVNKISEVLDHVCLPAGHQGENRDYVGKIGFEELESDFSQVLQCYSQIEDVIEDYAGKKNIVRQLSQIYDIIFNKYLSDPNYPTPVPHPTSLLDLLHNLLQKLQISKQEYKSIDCLDYIWKDVNKMQGYCPRSQQQIEYRRKRQKFINELCRNDILIFEAIKKVDQIGIQDKLRKLGYRKNVD